VLRRIFGGWRRLHIEELHNLYTSPNIVKMIRSRKIKWSGHVARMGEIRNAYRILVGKPEGKKPIGKPSHRWENNIKLDRTEVRWEVEI
jgi:hypothetical protein